MEDPPLESGGCTPVGGVSSIFAVKWAKLHSSILRRLALTDGTEFGS